MLQEMDFSMENHVFQIPAVAVGGQVEKGQSIPFLHGHKIPFHSVPTSDDQDHAQVIDHDFPTPPPSSICTAFSRAAVVCAFLTPNSSEP